MKKVITMLAILLLLTSSVTALAHGHSTSSKPHKVCTVRSCKKKTNHKHGRKTYRAHHSKDGHKYHKSNHH